MLAVILLTFISISNEKLIKATNCASTSNCLNGTGNHQVIDGKRNFDKAGLNEGAQQDNTSTGGVRLNQEEKLSNELSRRNFFNSKGDFDKPTATFQFSLRGNKSGKVDSNWNWDDSGYQIKKAGSGVYEGYGKGQSSLDLGPASIQGKYSGNLKGGGLFGYQKATSDDNMGYGSTSTNHLSGAGNANFDFDYFGKNIGGFGTLGKFNQFNMDNNYGNFSKDGSFEKKQNTKSFSDYFTKGAGDLRLDQVRYAGDFIGSGREKDIQYYNKQFQNQPSGWHSAEDNLKNGSSNGNFESNFEVTKYNKIHP